MVTLMIVAHLDVLNSYTLELIRVNKFIKDIDKSTFRPLMRTIYIKNYK